MFGYVKPYKQELKIKDYEVFKAYYCGLCRSIKENFGNLPRVSLNYDMTFMAILLDSLDDNEGSFYIGRCLLHPTKRRMILKSNPALIYAAYLNIALTYYKLCDDVQDERSFKSKFLSHLMKGYSKAFCENYIDMDSIIKENLSTLYSYEKYGTVDSLDEFSTPFANLTGEVIKNYNGSLDLATKENLYSLGYNLGKWIYIMDALDDLQKDMLQGKFNPINKVFNKTGLSFHELYKALEKRLEFSILCSANAIVDSYQRLNIFKNNELLSNILTLGLMNRYEQILNKYKQILLKE